MAYSRVSPNLVLPGSPSHQPNNLSSCDILDNIAYIRFSEVIVSSMSGASKRIPISSRCHIYQAAFVHIQGVPFIALTSSLGVQIWTTDGGEMKYFFAISSLVDSEEEGHFMRGVTAIKTGFICVGSSTGNIIILKATSADGEGIELQETLETSKNAITAIHASDQLLVCANDIGDIIGFNVESAFEVKCRFSGAHFPCTSILTRFDMIIAAYSTGHIRLFRPQTSELVIEIAAHARCITGLAIHPSLNILASVSEDQFLIVWQLPANLSRAANDIDLLFSEKIDNHLLTGVAFVSDEKIGVVSFDEDDMIMFKMG